MAAKNTKRRGSSRVVVALSPRAGSGRRREVIPALIQYLEAGGYDVVVSDQVQGVCAACSDLPDGMSLAAVIAAGGDGTIRLIAHALPPGVPIYPLPMGTENLLARHFGYTHLPMEAVAALDAGRTRQIDAGSANGRLFLIMATCGFDAEVVRAMHLTRRGHINRWSYAKPILRAVRRYRYPEIRVRSDASFSASSRMGETDELINDALTCRWAMVFNLPMYGGGLRIVQDAVPDDGKMNFVGLLQGCSRSTLRYLATVYTGRLKHCQDLRAALGTRWRWETSQRVAYQLDGDYAGRLPVSIETLPRRVTLVVPAGG